MMAKAVMAMRASAPERARPRVLAGAPSIEKRSLRTIEALRAMKARSSGQCRWRRRPAKSGRVRAANPMMVMVMKPRVTMWRPRL